MHENGLLGFLVPSDTRFPQDIHRRKKAGRARPGQSGGDRAKPPRPLPPSGPWRAAAAPRGPAPRRPVPRLRGFPPPPSFFLATTSLALHQQIKLPFCFA